MNKYLRLLLFIFLISVPIFFYKASTNQPKQEKKTISVRTISKIPGKITPKGSGTENDINKPQVSNDENDARTKIALIFDDLGESLNELKDIYSLDIPLTISVIPGLKFSRNIAHIGMRSGYTVLIHLPFEPKQRQLKNNKFRYISGSLKEKEVKSLLRSYLNHIKIAKGVNNHMGSKATENPKLMRIVFEELKKRDLIFIDSRTSLDSVAYNIAQQMDVRSAYNEGFIDSLNDPRNISERIKELVKIAKNKGRIIVIAHPKKNTIEVLRKEIPQLKSEIHFITIEEYFK
ncbi:MAG: divergent polysaccharide deacetylase family protein [Candidatus Omnitrophota bacterium]